MKFTQPIGREPPTPQPKVKTEAYFIQRIYEALNNIDDLLEEAQKLGFDTERLQREAEKY